MQAIVDQKADIRLYEESGVHQQFPNADKLGDKGYQSQAHSEIISPHKKPKGGELTPEQRQENRQIAQQRIYVEHSIRRIRGWRILREDYRLGVGLFPNDSIERRLLTCMCPLSTRVRVPLANFMKPPAKPEA